MYGRYYGGEHYAASSTVGEYGAQIALSASLAVGDYIYGVAVGNEAREGVGNKVEVLMIYPLGSAAETYHRCIGASLSGVMSAAEVKRICLMAAIAARRKSRGRQPAGERRRRLPRQSRHWC